MFVEAIKRVEEALFPIVRLSADFPEKGRITVCVTGCGFFIDDRGTFASVAHAFDDPPPNSKYFFIGRLPDQLINPWLDISEVARDECGDVLLGKVATLTPDFLPLSRETVPIGESVCASGYPLAKIAVTPRGGFEFGGVKRRFRSTMVIGRTQCAVERGRVQKGVLLQDPSLFGMSGGAVVDAAGMAVGMMGSVTNPEESIGGNGSRKITVENGSVITADQIYALYERTVGLRSILLPAAEIASAEEKKSA